MKLKKLLALGLAAMMAVSALSACGSNEEKDNSVEVSKESSEVKESSAEKEPEASSSAAEEEGISFPLDEQITLTGITVLQNGQYKIADTAAWQKMEEYGNIHVEWTDFQNSEMKEKLSLTFAGGDYPELLYKTTVGDNLDQYTPEGYLLPLEDLIKEYMPNLTALLDEREAWAAVTAADGHIYMLPSVGNQGLYNGGAPLWINKKWMDTLGLKEPENFEQLYEVLKAFKEGDPNGNGKADEIPFTFTISSSWFPPERLLAYMGDGVHDYTKRTAIIDGKVVYYPATEGFKDNYLAFLTKLYAEGLLDPNCFTQTQEQLGVEGKANNIYGMFFRTNASEQVPTENIQDYITLKPFADNTLPLSTGVSAHGMAITDKCENPEVICAWLDYLYTDEGSHWNTHGVEGVSYTLNDKGEYTYIEGIEPGMHDLDETSAGCGKRSQLSPDSEKNPDDAWQIAQRNELYKNGTVLLLPSYTQEEIDVRVEIATEINGYINTYTAQVVTGELDLEDSWQEFQDTLKAMGVDKLIAVYEAVYGRAMNK